MCVLEGRFRWARNCPGARSLLGERRSSVGSESDTEIVGSRGDSEVDEDAAVEVFDTSRRQKSRSVGLGCELQSSVLDDVDPQRNFEKRASSPSRSFCELKLALEEATAGDDVRAARGWKLLLMLPRMLLHRRPGGGIIANRRW